MRSELFLKLMVLQSLRLEGGGITKLMNVTTTLYVVGQYYVAHRTNLAGICLENFL
jgi:hypothetical protein